MPKQKQNEHQCVGFNRPIANNRPTFKSLNSASKNIKSEFLRINSSVQYMALYAWGLLIHAYIHYMQLPIYTLDSKMK